MRKRNRILSIFLVASMVGTMLMGCGKAKEETKESSTTSSSGVVESTVPASSEEDKEPIVLKAYFKSDASADDAKVHAAANEYIQEKLGFTVEFINISQAEYAEKMKMLFASGEEFDICFTSASDEFDVNVSNGVYLALDDLLVEEGKDVYESAPEGIFGAATIDGKIYAVPHQKDWVTPIIFGGKSYLVKKHNIDLSQVKTLEDMTPVLQTIKDNEPEYVPFLMKGNYNLSRVLPYERISAIPVIAFDEKTGEIVSIYETEDMKDFMLLMRDWNLKGFFPADVETLTTLDDYTNSGLFFSMAHNYTPYIELKKKEAESGTEKIYDYSEYLLKEAYLTTSGVMGAAWAISAETKYPKESMQLINFIDTDTYLRNLLAYGIEGTHYVKDGENRYAFPEGATKAADTGYAPFVALQGSCYNLYVTGSRQSDYWDKMKELNLNAAISPALGFSVDIEPIATEVAAIGNVYNQYAQALECGAVEIEENLATFVDKLYSVGLQDVIDEVNKQYEEWKAINK